ncbi:MAG TPA: carbohydrate ABC transporter permease [Clostridiales bacterium]|nr:carbohydrate ABC transporter permease [Clostridiales bacterium]
MKKNRFSVFDLLIYVILIVIIICILFPLLHVVAVSFSSAKYIFTNDITIYPKGFNVEVYKWILRDPKIYNAYKNTLYYVSLGTVLSLIATSTGAYALSKKKLVFRKKFMGAIILTMFFSGGMIPSFLTIKNLGIYNTTWAVVLPGLVSSWYLIVMKSFFEAFPGEIEESGELDGLNDIGTFWYLVLPVSKPVLAAIGLFYAVGLWNSYYTPFIYLDSQNKFPLQLILRSLLVQGQGLEGRAGQSDQPVILESIKYATIIVSVVPIIIVYPFLQKYFVTGVLVGSIKG